MYVRFTIGVGLIVDGAYVSFEDDPIQRDDPHCAKPHQLQHANDIRAAIAEMLKVPPMADVEEWAMHDYEGFEGVSQSGYAAQDCVAALAAFIAEHGALGGKLVDYQPG